MESISLGKELQLLEVRDVNGFQAAFATVERSKTDALLILSSQLMRTNSKIIAEFTIRRRLAAVAPYRDFPEVGGLMSYGPSLPAWYKRCGVQLGKLLRGAKASELPIERPDRFDFVLNSTTAKTIRLKIPQSLLLRAELIQ